MSETVYAFSEPRKWRVAHAVSHVRRIWSAVSLTPRVRRGQWEGALRIAVDALATTSSTSDDQWSRDYAQRALVELAEYAEGWSK